MQSTSEVEAGMQKLSGLESWGNSEHKLIQSLFHPGH